MFCVHQTCLLHRFSVCFRSAGRSIAHQKLSVTVNATPCPIIDDISTSISTALNTVRSSKVTEVIMKGPYSNVSDRRHRRSFGKFVAAFE